MSSMTYVRFIFFYKTYIFFLISQFTVTKNIVYLISKDKILTFKDVSKIFLFWG